jgi:hypothetical protein
VCSWCTDRTCWLEVLLRGTCGRVSCGSPAVAAWSPGWMHCMFLQCTPQDFCELLLPPLMLGWGS